MADGERSQSNLPKYVQINWCGDGVPEAKKGLFHTHSSAVGRQLLHGSHVVLNARNEVCACFLYRATADGRCRKM